jgi:hypothetical protein
VDLISSEKRGEVLILCLLSKGASASVATRRRAIHLSEIIDILDVGVTRVIARINL